MYINIAQKLPVLLKVAYLCNQTTNKEGKDASNPPNPTKITQILYISDFC
ncbi:hypothetical protein HH_1253 [Helicobacter hepaticus ATCC 51449]|uniref:Uncharacterized protein n=1 Tax=Helicobacter hepaticus (strain ATCC 51449 / 3B1) TaxID=235279 RepID=Q7VGR7_HELHP|nr:hypothetical protein HH_1253 [Helicobacter hepaticus ATCC 51449]